jgi:hypothetical protein
MTFSMRVLQSLSEHANALSKMALFHSFEIVLKSLIHVVNFLHRHKKKKFNIPIVNRNTYLIEAHMQRLHDKLSPELMEALQDLLRASDKITNAMIEIAMMREFYATAQET